MFVGNSAQQEERELGLGRRTVTIWDQHHSIALMQRKVCAVPTERINFSVWAQAEKLAAEAWAEPQDGEVLVDWDGKVWHCMLI